MTWQEANLALQLLAEERVGAEMRAIAQRARAREDAAVGIVGRIADAQRGPAARPVLTNAIAGEPDGRGVR
jgi:hypothetical protein